MEVVGVSDQTVRRMRLTTEPNRWFLSADERENDETVLDQRHLGGLAWSMGNQVRPLLHGAVYCAELLGAVE